MPDSRKKYTLDSFLERVASKPHEVFDIPYDQRTWMKTYLMTANDNWQDFFSNYHPSQLGEMYHFKMPFGDNQENVDYYVHEIGTGLLMFFTLSKIEEYNQTLRNFVRHRSGINGMWLPPQSFNEISQYIQSKYDATITSFTAKRSWSTHHPSKKRPEFNRHIHYSGDDAGISLKELKEEYGVLPTLIDFKINDNLLRITNDGLFLLRNVNRTMLRIIEEVILQVIAEQTRLRSISKQVDYKKKSIVIGKNQIDTTKVMAGKILFNTSLSASLVDHLFSSFKDSEFGRNEVGEESMDFSFIDKNINEEGLSYSATIVDEDKGTVFGLSGNETSMVLVPKHRTTYESFINFYRLVSETIDNTSQLHLFNENIVR